MKKLFTLIVLFLTISICLVNAQANKLHGTYASAKNKSTRILLKPDMTFKYNLGLRKNSWQEGKYELKGDAIFLNYYSDTLHTNLNILYNPNELFTGGPTFKKPKKLLLKVRKLYTVDETTNKPNGTFMKLK